MGMRKFGSDILRRHLLVRLFYICAVIVTNNLAGFIFSRVGYRDLGIYFSNKLGL
jgi:hypothetical protein